MISDQTQTVIKQIRDLSNKGNTAFLNGYTDGSFECYTEAYTIATQTLEHTTAQPDRAHLFRLAASMALCLGNAQDALRLARTGLDEAMTSPLVPFNVESDIEDVYNAACMSLQVDSEDDLAAPTIAPESSLDSKALEDARAVLRGATGLSGDQALGVLEGLRRILGVTV